MGEWQNPHFSTKSTWMPQNTGLYFGPKIRIPCYITGPLGNLVIVWIRARWQNSRKARKCEKWQNVTKWQIWQNHGSPCKHNGGGARNRWKALAYVGPQTGIALVLGGLVHACANLACLSSQRRREIRKHMLDREASSPGPLCIEFSTGWAFS